MAADDRTDSELVDAWRASIERPEVVGALRRLHVLVGEEVAQRRPVCLASGQCCHFERFGHRLYVTGLEAAWCVRSLRQRSGPTIDAEALAAARRRGDCPFLLEGRLCGAHIERPLGCRIYFCDRASATWQQELYERIHSELIELHRGFDVPYRYGEWRAMLAMVV